MDLDKWLYDLFNGWITKDQLIYFGALITLIIGLLTIYKNILKNLFLKLKIWSKHIFNSFEHIEQLEKKVQDISNSVKANGELIQSTILPNFDRIETKLIFVQKELSTNAGKSLKDIINKIMVGIETVEKLSSSLDYQVKKIEARQWNVMINNLDIPMWESDSKGFCIRGNKALLDLVGVPLDELVNSGWVNIIFLDDRKMVQHEWEGAIEDKRTFDLKYRIQNITSNKVYSVRAVAQTVFVEKELVGYIGRYVNIVELYQDQNSGLWIKK